MNFFRRFLRNEMTMNKLGRWKIQYEPQIIDLKITQANEDHCGCCEIVENNIKKTNTNFALVCINKSNKSIMKIN